MNENPVSYDQTQHVPLQEIEARPLTLQEQLVVQVRSLLEQHPRAFLVEKTGMTGHEQLLCHTQVHCTDGQLLGLQVRRGVEARKTEEIILVFGQGTPIYELTISEGAEIDERYKKFLTLGFSQKMLDALLGNYTSGLGKRYHVQESMLAQQVPLSEIFAFLEGATFSLPPVSRDALSYEKFTEFMHATGQEPHAENGHAEIMTTAPMRKNPLELEVLE